MKRAHRSIRTRLAVSVFVAVALFLAVDHGLRRASFRGTFEEMENTRAGEVLNGVDRAIQALAGELSHYSESMIRTDGPKSVDCDELGIEAAFVVARDGSVLRSARSKRADQSPAFAKALARSFPNQEWAEKHPIFRAWIKEETPRGIFPVIGSGSLLLFGAAEVVVDGERALSVAIRAVDGYLLEEIAQIADVRPQFFLLNHPATDRDDLARVDEATATRRPVIAARSSFAVSVYSPLIDFTGMPVGGIKADIPLRHAELWNRMERFEMLTAAGVAVVFPLLLLVLVQLVVTRPLGQLTSHIVQIGQSDDASSRLDSGRSDEIGTLAQEFDRMLEKLERSRVLQQRSARLTGRSEVAADVVHNTGNILNSIAVSSSLACQNAADLDVGDLRLLHAELVRHESDLAKYLQEDPRGKHAVAFLGATIDHLDAGLAGLADDAKGVEALVEKAAEMLRYLTSDQSSGSVKEPTDLKQVLTEAVHVAGVNEEDISIEYHLSEASEVQLDRQRLLEALTSVIENSVCAMRNLPPVERALVLSLTKAGTNYQLQIQDTGVGIDPEVLPHVFEMGTSSKEHAPGLGLHQASLAMIAIGGDIRLESAGVGLGATATLTVPARSQHGESREDSVDSSAGSGPAEPSADRAA